jgi:hypothetical protein
MNYYVVLHRVVSIFATFLAVWLPYFFGWHLGKTYPQKWRNYLTVAGMIAVACLALWSSYGTHFENSDPIYGGGDEVQDFVPTDKQRNEYGLKILLTLEIAALWGVAVRNRDRSPFSNLYDERTKELVVARKELAGANERLAKVEPRARALELEIANLKRTPP